MLKPPLATAANNLKSWTRLPGSSLSLALSEAFISHEKKPFLIVVPDALMASHLFEELVFFCGSSAGIFLFPDWETLPYDRFSPHQDIISERLSTLNQLPKLNQFMMIVSVNTLMQRIAPIHYLVSTTFILKVGEMLDVAQFKTQLIKGGYQAVSTVREHGEYAIRGSIIDVFPMGSEQPFRLDLLDNQIDSIRLFSVEHQRSLEQLNSICLLPAKEFPLSEQGINHFREAWRKTFQGNPLQCSIYQDISEGICAPGIEYYLPLFFEETATLFDYLPSETCCIAIEDINTKAKEYWQEIEVNYEQRRHDLTRPILAPEQLFLSPSSIEQKIKSHPLINVKAIPNRYSHHFSIEPAPSLAINSSSKHPLQALENFLQTQSGRVLFCVETMGRREIILQLLKKISLEPKYVPSWQAFIEDNCRYGIIVAPIEEGFCLREPALSILTESVFYGKRIMQRRLRKQSNQEIEHLIRDLTELKLGDPIVHIDHGIGRYRGLETIAVGQYPAEFLSLEYYAGDKLYVPVHSLHLISRYTGADEEHAPLHQLGLGQWQRAKQKAQEKIRDIAAELLDLYAAREAQKREPCKVPDEHYLNFAQAFPFEETPDQFRAIEEVFQDMTSPKPMDRVICGDVGFGKTEVALRAAFLAAHNAKQVAVLVPTTLLAEQHFQNFQTRFADWPIRVGLLSRFHTGLAQKKLLTEIQEGKIDIVIGTHKLLQADVQFKSLGLVIIDEEHRFGVKQKEKLKSLRALVDMLTLTATPIPRTLNMALSGIRHLSIIATPPAKRLSVKTFIHEYDEQLIKEAIHREIMRGGQVYFLHNEVKTIHKKAEEINALLPEVKTEVAHGQMAERDLERVMSAFYHRQCHVLVCSTIIESGIDIPTANTIIINRADKFGLAQLHQLRGRVGRSHHQAYAYLIVPEKKSITADALKRLEAIHTLGDLGVGFSLATHDLEIRGAGELLGENQSGDMHEIGFSLYMELLSRSIEALKNNQDPQLEKTLQQHHTEIDLGLPALIPEDYLPDIQLRLHFYKRIASAKSETALDEIQVEMIDRFGLLPDPLKNIFAYASLKLTALSLGILKIESNEKNGKFEFTQQPQIKAEKIIYLIQNQASIFRLEGANKLRFNLPSHAPAERINLIENMIHELT